MSHQWQAYDHHDTLAFKLTDNEERKLIKAWQQSGSFDETIKEISSKESCYE